MNDRSDRLILAVDLAGTAVFALEGALAAITGCTVCFLLRVVSVWQHWNLPRAGAP